MVTIHVWTNERTDRRTNTADGQPENTMPSLTLSGGEYKESASIRQLGKELKML